MVEHPDGMNRHRDGAKQNFQHAAVIIGVPAPGLVENLERSDGLASMHQRHTEHRADQIARIIERVRQLDLEVVVCVRHAGPEDALDDVVVGQALEQIEIFDCAGPISPLQRQARFIPQINQTLLRTQDPYDPVEQDNDSRLAVHSGQGGFHHVHELIEKFLEFVDGDPMILIPADDAAFWIFRHIAPRSRSRSRAAQGFQALIGHGISG